MSITAKGRVAMFLDELSSSNIDTFERATLVKLVMVAFPDVDGQVALEAAADRQVLKNPYANSMDNPATHLAGKFQVERRKARRKEKS